jgi:hypothetical protein
MKMIAMTSLPYDGKTNMKLSTCAHCLDDEFEEQILADYGVRVSDKQGAPWTVVFSGTRDGLIGMFNDNWPEGDTANLISLATDQVTEVTVSA